MQGLSSKSHRARKEHRELCEIVSKLVLQGELRYTYLKGVDGTALRGFLLTLRAMRPTPVSTAINISFKTMAQRQPYENQSSHLSICRLSTQW